MVREALTEDALTALEPRDAAAYFIARRAEGLTASEQQMLDDWLAESETHRRLFESADLAWRSFSDSGDDEILAAMRAHARKPQSRRQAPWMPAAAAAAVLLLAASGALFLVPGLNPWSPPATSIGYASARGEVQELELSDGSRMTLDADSAATARLSATKREVDLQRGRALFDITPDPSRPFSVTAGGHRVVALGTRFDVNLALDGLTVTLLEGRVEVSPVTASGPSVTLEPGQQYVERLNRASIRTVGAAGENVIAWRDGLISFDNHSLSEAAAIMNRYSREQIAIDDPSVAALTVSGQFRAADLQRFADTVAEMHGLQSVRENGQIRLLRK